MDENQYRTEATRSICFARDVWHAIEKEIARKGYGSRSRLVNHMARQYFQLKHPKRKEKSTP